MGSEKFLLIIVTVIFIGIAIAVGYFLFGANAVASNKDGLVGGINNLGLNAMSYRIRGRQMGGGEGSYAGYNIPQKFLKTDDGTFVAEVHPQSITFTGTSKQGYGTIQAILDSSGVLHSFSYTGEFQ